MNILGIDAPGAPSRLVSRREVFAGAAALLGAGLLCTPALDAQMLNPQVPPTDLTLLNYFLTLENLEAAFWTQGLAKFSSADFANAAFVHAAPFAEWRGLDLGKLKVTLTVNGETVLEQAGGHATGDPLGIAVALVDMMREQGGVRAGQFVTCGSYTGLRYLKPGDECRVSFADLGSASVKFSD